MAHLGSDALVFRTRKGSGMKLSRLVISIALLSLALAVPASAATGVPIKGTVLGGGPPPDLEAPGCVDAIWRFNNSGTGNMSHLGKVEYSLTHCTYPDFTFGDGTITFTAANKDTLVIAQEGVCNPIADETGFIGFTCEGTWTVVDGTGRFAHAMGSGSLDIVGDVPGGDAVFGLPDGMMQTHFDGTIVYDASDRSQR